MAAGGEHGLQLRIGNILHGDAAIDGEGGSGTGGLAEDHVDGLHTDGRVGDVRRGKANGDEKIAALGFLRDERVIADAIGTIDWETRWAPSKRTWPSVSTKVETTWESRA